MLQGSDGSAVFEPILQVYPRNHRWAAKLKKKQPHELAFFKSTADFKRLALNHASLPPE